MKLQAMPRQARERQPMLLQALRRGASHVLAARRPARGFTMTELLITMAVAAVLLALAAPSMRDYIARKRVQGVASDLVSDLRYARSLQLLQPNFLSQTQIRFTSNAVQSCYVIYNFVNEFSGCDCAAAPVCSSRIENGTTPTAFKIVSYPASSGLTMAPSDRSWPQLAFAPETGLPKDGATLEIEVSAPHGGKLAVSTNGVGRPSVCSVQGHESTYGACAQ